MSFSHGSLSGSKQIEQFLHITKLNLFQRRNVQTSQQSNTFQTDWTHLTHKASSQLIATELGLPHIACQYLTSIQLND
jgi:hypothetical protein